MADDIVQFRSVSGFSRLKEVQRGSLRCVALKLRDKSVCLYSPVRATVSATEALRSWGRIDFLLAPNHYHNAGLAEHLQLYPRAQLCASEAAAVRLRLVTGLRFHGLDACVKAFGPGTSILHPDGLKTGEVWLRVSEKDNVAWVVTDAFCGPKRSPGDVVDTPEVLKTFPGFGIADRAAYIAWVRRQIALDQPTTLIPCHGALVQDAGLPQKLEQLLAELEKPKARSSVRRTRS